MSLLFIASPLGTALRSGAAVCLLVLGGCLHIPAPWSVDRGKSVDKAAARVDASRDEVLRRAQVDAYLAEVALRFAPDSRPVAVARESLSAASSLQAQALGPVPEKARQQTEALALGLLSEDPEIRGAAETKRAAEDRKDAAAAERLVKLESDLTEAQGNLRAAYAREKALNDTVRRVVWTCIGLGALAALLLGLLAYARMALGGVGAALHAAGAPAEVISAIDAEISKFGQWMIRTGRTAAAKLQAARSVS